MNVKAADSYTIIQKDAWKRKEVFELFNGYDEPYHSIVVDMDISICKKNVTKGFYLTYLHKTLVAINHVRELKMRINTSGDILLYDQINVSATIARDDHTFGFSYIVFDESIDSFEKNYNKEVERVTQSSYLFPPKYDINCIHLSTLPWVKFTSLSHARSFKVNNGIPMITFGKVEGTKMPMAVHVHHGLVDGYHLGQFVELLQSLLDQ